VPAPVPDGRGRYEAIPVESRLRNHSYLSWRIAIDDAFALAGCLCVSGRSHSGVAQRCFSLSHSGPGFAMSRNRAMNSCRVSVIGL